MLKKELMSAKPQAFKFLFWGIGLLFFSLPVFSTPSKPRLNAWEETAIAHFETNDWSQFLSYAHWLRVHHRWSSDEAKAHLVSLEIFVLHQWCQHKAVENLTLAFEEEFKDRPFYWENLQKFLQLRNPSRPLPSKTELSPDYLAGKLQWRTTWKALEHTLPHQLILRIRDQCPPPKR
jgi:hypothetical protein